MEWSGLRSSGAALHRLIPGVGTVAIVVAAKGEVAAERAVVEVEVMVVAAGVAAAAAVARVGLLHQLVLP